MTLQRDMLISWPHHKQIYRYWNSNSKIFLKETWTYLDTGIQIGRKKIVGDFWNKTSNLGSPLKGVNLESRKVEAGNSVTFLTCDSWFNFCNRLEVQALLAYLISSLKPEGKSQVNLYHIKYSQWQCAYYELSRMSKNSFGHFRISYLN